MHQMDSNIDDQVKEIVDRTYAEKSFIPTKLRSEIGAVPEAIRGKVALKVGEILEGACIDNSEKSILFLGDAAIVYGAAGLKEKEEAAWARQIQVRENSVKKK